MVNNVLLRINLKQDNIEGERYAKIEVNSIKQNILIYIIEQESLSFLLEDYTRKYLKLNTKTYIILLKF